MRGAEAFELTRAINAVAWKMPLPVPEWFAEVQDQDLVQQLIETLQFVDATHAQLSVALAGPDTVKVTLASAPVFSYAAVIDIDAAKLPPADEVYEWSAEQFVAALKK